MSQTFLSIVDSGIDEQKKSMLNSYIIYKILKDNTTDLLSKDFKEKIDKDNLNIEKNESRFKGAKGDKGEPGQPGAKGEQGQKKQGTQVKTVL